MRSRHRAIVLALVVALTAGACSSGDSTESAPARREVVRGRAQLDGRAFDARWIGAVVRHDGLVTPCQAALPPIRDGRFRIPVFTRAGAAGCGTAGSEVLFWTFGEAQLFAGRWLPWSRRDEHVTLRFSSRDPNGASPARTELSGRAFDARGRRVPLGTRIEARIGSTTCGVASVRSGGGFTGYIMNVVGPDSIPACADGATITFLIGATPANETAVNGRTERELFRLTARAPS